MSNRIVTEDDVVQSLNRVERLANRVSGDDEYMAAILNNQAIMASAFVQMAGFSQSPGETTLNVQGSSVDPNNLPNGMIGVSQEDIKSGTRGYAVFEIKGSKFNIGVTAQNDISSGDVIGISGAENQAIPMPSAKAAYAVSTGSATDGATADRAQSTADANYVSLNVTATADEQTVSWGFLAGTVLLYAFTQPVTVAFKEPGTQDREITLDPDDGDEPAEFAPLGGLNTDEMWFKRSDAATEDTTIKALAFI